MGRLSTSATWRKKGKKMKQNSQTWDAVLIDLHQSATDSSVCLQTQMCIHIHKSSTVDFYSFITKKINKKITPSACMGMQDTRGESAQRTERELRSRLHGNEEKAGASTCRNNSDNTTRTRAAGLLCISLFLCHSFPSSGENVWTKTTGCSSCWN